jgi:hypothetical protein
MGEPNSPRSAGTALRLNESAKPALRDFPYWLRLIRGECFGVENKGLGDYIWQMTTVAIDTLRYVKRLRAVGFTEEQAEVQAEALSEAVRDSLVTKADLNEGLEKLRTELKADIQGIRVEIRDLHTGLLRWLIPLIIGQTAVVAALVKLL